jgi:enoyl-CoA hydratase
MSEPLLLRTETGGVLEIVLNRPAKLNAINREMWEGIRDAIEDFRSRHELRVMLFRANGKYFSAGSDLTDYDGDFEDSPMRARNWMRRDLSAGMHRMFVEMERIEKPFVVAHHAMCIGGSLELSLSCDFRLASRSAQYWFPEMQFGMVPLSGGISRLTRLVGPHWANWMAVANKKISAERALAIGLIHEVGKMAIQLAADLGSDDARQVERLAFSSLTFAPEYTKLHESIRARLSKHDPGER